MGEQITCITDSRSILHRPRSVLATCLTATAPLRWLHRDSELLLQHQNLMHFQELVAAASKFEFSQNGIHAVTRDYMHATLWDIRNNSRPIRTFQVRTGTWPPATCGHLLDPVISNEPDEPCT